MEWVRGAEDRRERPVESRRCATFFAEAHLTH